jgi:tetratricopeptide (TPR) repeat protein
LQAPLAALLLTLFQAPTYAADSDPVAQSTRLFEAGKFSLGLEVLVRERDRHGVAPARQARILVALARFYDRYVGSRSETALILEQLLRLPLPPGNPSRAWALATKKKLAALATRYRSQDALLDRVSVESINPGELRGRIAQLRELIKNNPNYPGLAAACYYLGRHLMLLEEHRAARRAFDRALELRPALGYHLPVDYNRDTVVRLLLRRDLGTAARVVLGAMWLLALVLFLRSRPWRTLGLRHALLLGALAGSWWLFFRATVWLGGHLMSQQDPHFPPPVYLYTNPGSPMSGALDTLFWFGLVGLAGAFLIAASTARFRYRWTWAIFSATASALLLSGLLTLFYLRHLEVPFQPAAKQSYSLARGIFYFPTGDHSPFLLTNPTAYCHFQATIEDLDEEQVRHWFKKFAGICKRGRRRLAP